MSCSFPIEDIEALVLGELSESRAEDVAAHLADCEHCAEQRDWFRLELDAFDARRDADDGADLDALWSGVEAGIADSATSPAVDQPRRTGGLVWFASGFAAAAVAAAAVFVLARPGTTAEPRVITKVIQGAHHTNDASVRSAVHPAGTTTLDEAEQQYLAALERLKREFRKRHGQTHPDIVRDYEREMNANLRRLRAARAAAGDDVDGRMRVLDAYSAYVRTLQSAAEGMDI